MIEVRNLTKSYQTGEFDLQILKGISFRVEDGELCAIMGPSGSGKSTLMNILGCLDTPTDGEYLLDDENVATFDEVRLAQVRNRKIGFVFQSFNLLKRTTALDNVSLPLMYAGVEPQERHNRAVAALNAVGLGDRLDHKPNQLSGGQQQRVAIARSLVTTPSLILADEPTGNLDSKSSVEVMDIFQRLNAQLGITIMFVTHEPDIAEYTRRVLRIRDGYLGADERILEPRSAAAELAAGDRRSSSRVRRRDRAIPRVASCYFAPDDTFSSPGPLTVQSGGLNDANNRRCTAYDCRTGAVQPCRYADGYTR